MNDAVFVTGATGLVGSLLLRRIAQENPERRVFALVRGGSAAIDLPNTNLIQGDITQPQLGISNDVYERVSRSIGVIVHCAASTKFTLPLDASRQVNVCGTANVLHLARRSPNVRLLLHISSTFIAGRRGGELDEAPLRDPAGWCSPYEQSKFEAEQLICDQPDTLPWVIARLSTLAGHSRTGHVTQFNYFHQLLRLVPRNPFPIIPGDSRARVDVVADDWVAGALLALVEEAPRAGSVVHLCAGPRQSIPAQEILELAFALHRRNRPDSRTTMPSFVSMAEFQEFAAGLRKRGAETLCRVAELLLLCLPHLEMRQDFLNAKTTALLAPRGIVPLRTRDFLPLVISSCW